MSPYYDLYSYVGSVRLQSLSFEQLTQYGSDLTAQIKLKQAQGKLDQVDILIGEKNSVNKELGRRCSIVQMYHTEY